MKINAAMCQPPVAGPARAREEPASVAGLGPSVPDVPVVPHGAAAPGAPERTVLGELHRMFALIAIR